VCVCILYRTLNPKKLIEIQGPHNPEINVIMDSKLMHLKII